MDGGLVSDFKLRTHRRSLLAHYAQRDIAVTEIRCDSPLPEMCGWRELSA
jgi:hypothetical protein